MAAFQYLIGGRKLVIHSKLRKLLCTDDDGIKLAYKDLRMHESFLGHISGELSSIGKYIGWVFNAPELYVIVRILKPSIVVETGVAAGLSSAFILRALEDNNEGVLYSVDLPNYEVVYGPKIGMAPISILPEGRKPGWIIPQDLRNRWNLILGMSSMTLDVLLGNLGYIDMFFHDSEHTYDNMMFEYKTSWSHMHHGGLLLSDNARCNSAFRDFARTIGRKPTMVWCTDFGAIKK